MADPTNARPDRSGSVDDAVARTRVGRAPDGTFGEDLQRWIDIWTNHPGRPGTLAERTRMALTHNEILATGLFRLSTRMRRRGIPVVPMLLRRLNITLFGLDMVPGTPVGGGLYIPHTVGTVVMAQKIGRNATLVSNVTIGMRNTVEFPVIGDDVYVGAGARVIGAVTIADGAVIGANAVVIADVPPGALAVGVPARIVPRSKKRPKERTGEV
jgi:serine O-acetyltransferase